MAGLWAGVARWRGVADRAMLLLDVCRKTASGKLRRVELRNAEYKKKAKVVEEIKAKL